MQIEDGLRLELRQAEAALELATGSVGVFGAADEGDYGIEVVEGDLEAFENMRPVFCRLKFELRPPGDDYLAEFDIELQGFFQIDNLGFAVYQGQHIDEKAGLQVGVLMQVVQYLLRLAVALEVEDDS